MSSKPVALTPLSTISPEFSLAWLNMNSPQRVHRRVEALRLEENGKSRWHISHDVTVPEEFRILGSKNRMIAPLMDTARNDHADFFRPYVGSGDHF